MKAIDSGNKSFPFQRLGSASLESMLEEAGVGVDGNRPWDIQIDNPGVFRRVLTQGSLGLGEAYMDGWWHCRRVDQFIYRVMSAGLENRVSGGLKTLLQEWAARLINFQSRARAFIVGERHYDISLDLYRVMLDEGLNYSCGYWEDAETLDQAQINKLDLICRKLSLQPSQKVIDIGCGWGGFAEYAAREYGVEVLGVTISREQANHARERCRNLPVEIRLQDYRELEESADHIVSIGMFEHVGYKNYTTYMDVARRCLKKNGLFLLHTIGGNRALVKGDPWIQKYIFPNGMLPSVHQIGLAIEGRFVMEDWHNFGADYDHTLMAWHANFARHWDEFVHSFGERFCRMWEYYLLACAGAFRARKLQLWQLALSPAGVPGGYRSVR
jgi:cyclopropane-fatty-acyl-phospholipid synthase